VLAPARTLVGTRHRCFDWRGRLWLRRRFRCLEAAAEIYAVGPLAIRSRNTVGVWLDPAEVQSVGHRCIQPFDAAAAGVVVLTDEHGLGQQHLDRTRGRCDSKVTSANRDLPQSFHRCAVEATQTA
jgi:hypothetical protein